MNTGQKISFAEAKKFIDMIAPDGLPRIAGFLQACPALVLAPHLMPGQSGPNCHCSAASLKLVPM